MRVWRLTPTDWTMSGGGCVHRLPYILFYLQKQLEKKRSRYFSLTYTHKKCYFDGFGWFSDVYYIDQLIVTPCVITMLIYPLNVYPLKQSTKNKNKIEDGRTSKNNNNECINLWGPRRRWRVWGICKQFIVLKCAFGYFFLIVFSLLFV